MTLLQADDEAEEDEGGRSRPLLEAVIKGRIPSGPNWSPILRR